MPANTGQLEQDIRRLRTAMEELNKATGGAAAQWLAFGSALDRLSKSGTNIARLNLIKATFADFEKQLRMLGESAKLSEKQIQRLINTAARVAQTDVGKRKRLGFRGGGMGGFGEEIGGEEQAVGAYVETQKFMAALGPGGERQINTARLALKGMRFEMRDITDVTQDASRGLTRFTAQVGGGNIPIRRATVITNRWGQELKSTQRHLRTFGGAIVRDIVEVVKWTVAIAIVYAPLRRLQQTL